MSDLLIPDVDLDVQLDRVAAVLSRYRYRFRDEAALQAGIAAALTANQIAFHREEALSMLDRPDFLLDGGLAVEVKVKGSIAELLRQVARYLEHAEVRAVLVVGTPAWLNRVPDSLSGKPVRSLRFLGSLL